MTNTKNSSNENMDFGTGRSGRSLFDDDSFSPETDEFGSAGEINTSPSTPDTEAHGKGTSGSLFDDDTSNDFFDGEDNPISGGIAGGSLFGDDTSGDTADGLTSDPAGDGSDGANTPSGGKDIDDDVTHTPEDDGKDDLFGDDDDLFDDDTDGISPTGDDFDPDADGEIDLPDDWSGIIGTAPLRPGEKVGSISDGLLKSLNTYARVDIPFISEITGEDMKAVIGYLTETEAIYQNPAKWQECYYLGFETADEYLSGNILFKIRDAREANEAHPGYFDKNIAALKKVLPPKTSAEDIYVTIGSPWLPTEFIDQFILSVFGRAPGGKYKKEDLATKHDLITGSWEIPFKARYDFATGTVKTKVMLTYGTRFLNALEIIEKTLNQKLPIVYDEKPDPTKPGKKNATIRVINDAETLLATEKQTLIVEEFHDWIYKSETRKRQIADLYYEKYGCIKARHYRGEFLEFSDMAPGIQLYPYQKNAVARILFSPNTLLAHDVGAGKTFIMAAGGHELRRTGVSRKNMYVVPNNLTGQWRNAFLKLYPNSNLLVVNPPNFKKSIRQETLAKIRDDDYDAIIIAYSCFDRITVSNQCLLDSLKEQRQLLEDAALDKNRDTKNLRHRKKVIEDKIKELEAELQQNGIGFDELGINSLFLDEGHNYKNVKIDTKIQMLGISDSGSRKCQDMLEKVHFVQKQNCGRGVIFATGTPITNSISDVYTMQRYLQNGELELLELQSFDSWVGMFAEKHTGFEIDVDASNFRMATRLSRFYNIPELTALFSGVTDFHRVDNKKGLPQFDGYTNIVIPRSDELRDYLLDISKRADKVRAKMVPRTEDNLLKITVDGRKAALDMRLTYDTVSAQAPSDPDTKVYRCAEQVANVYFSTMSKRCAQLVFCDLSTPKNDGEFNIYSELRSLLIAMGVAEEEIAFVHDYDSERTRTNLFAMVNSGDIRVLIGSTSKLGMGVNVQTRLAAIHHLSVPWRPSDMAQREGRIKRQGNTCEKIQIFRYVTEGSFDSYIWQLLESKQTFIEELLSGFADSRSAQDVGDVSLDYGEIKALAIGDMRIKERIECANTLNRYRLLRAKENEMREELTNELQHIPDDRRRVQLNIELCEKDLQRAKENPLTPDVDVDALRDKLILMLRDYELSDKEVFAFDYRGFKVYIPTNMTRMAPYVILEGDNRHKIYFANGGKSHMTQIDDYINSLPERLVKLKENLKRLRAREKEIKELLDKQSDYDEKIEFYTKKLDELDEKLGVKQ